VYLTQNLIVEQYKTAKRTVLSVKGLKF